MHVKPFTLEHVDVGQGYWMVVDARGFPVAQGSRELCQGVIDRSQGRAAPEPDKPAEIGGTSAYWRHGRSPG